jgi:hypothetical protein
MVMDIQITSPKPRKGERGALLSLIGKNTPENPFIAEVLWPNGQTEELSSNDYQWQYKPTNKHGYDDWTMFNSNNKVTN